MSTTSTQSQLVSIAEAARRTGVSRRTIERWIERGLLAAVASEADRRQRLVSLAEAEGLVHESRHRQRPHPQAATALRTEVLTEPEDGRQTEPPDSAESLDYEAIIDQGLQLIYSHHHRLVGQLAPETFRPLSLDQLRAGPFGQDLSRLARLARGETREPKEHVIDAIEAILQLLFWPIGADDYTVPRTFWDTDFGRMLSRAKYGGYDPSELVSIGNAAQQLGVTRPTIYQWMDDRTLNYVRDDMSGRTFVVRRDIENLKRVALEWAKDELTFREGTVRQYERALDRSRQELERAIEAGEPPEVVNQLRGRLAAGEEVTEMARLELDEARHRMAATGAPRRGRRSITKDRRT